MPDRKKHRPDGAKRNITTSLTPRHLLQAGYPDQNRARHAFQSSMASADSDVEADRI
jgi:hypothetical protein